MEIANEQVLLTENGFWFGGTYIELNETSILLDGSLTKNALKPHVYCDILAALNCSELANASLERPVTLYIAPNVYWIDDPDAKDVLQKRKGYPLPYGVYVNCEALNIIGLSDDPMDVVTAGNRGQSHGCIGNYTMLHFRVEMLNISNITLGNYCSVDLEYPKNPALNRKKRTETITQAQIAIQDGKSLRADNCRFISRLNLCPVCGAKLALYEHCHFECTDDSLNGDAVYVDCDFDFYGSRPIYQASETGAAFIGCLFHIRGKGADSVVRQYFTKEGGAIALIDCRFECESNVSLGWTKYPAPSLKCYQYNVTLNGERVVIGGDSAAETVQLEGKTALGAYVAERDGRICANVENLLGATSVSANVKSAEVCRIPTTLKILTERRTITSGQTTVSLHAECCLFTGEACNEKIRFSLRSGDEEYALLSIDPDGSCTVEGCNGSSDAMTVVIQAVTESGLEAADAIVVEPYAVQAPRFERLPYIAKDEKEVTLEYELSSSERRDISEICWYRCDSPDGEGAVLCGVSKLGGPLKTYRFTEADAGKYLKAVIRPRVVGSEAGDAVSVIMAEPLVECCVDIDRLLTDFSEVPIVGKTANIKGSWAADAAMPSDIKVNSEGFGGWFMDESVPAWKYGETGNGSEGVGLYQGTQGARLRYTPSHSHGGDMCMTVRIDPAKTAGQGFGSAGQYLDLGIKFDNVKLNGYALRIIRVKESSDAVAMALIEYREGVGSYLTEQCLTSCFITDCTVKVALRGTRLTASIGTASPQPSHKVGKYAHELQFEAEVEGNNFDGVMLWHTGTIGAGGWQNTAMIHSIEVEYRDYPVQ